MNRSKLRRQIAWHAAKLMYERQESEYYRAKLKAARKLQKGWVKPADLPSNAEIRDEIQNFARQLEGEKRTQKSARHATFGLVANANALTVSTALIGSVLTGHIRSGSDIDIHLFSDSIQSIASELEYNGIQYDVTRKRVRKDGESTVYQHIHIYDRYEFELTVYPLNKLSFAFRSSITGKAIEKASIPQLRQLLEREYPGLDLQQELAKADEQVDRFQVYYSLLLPLENVKQNSRYHPEGDVLYHSLQVYDLACDQLPYDEEFLLAALLHDVGKGINPLDHVNSGLEALNGFITERTVWLIENHMLAHQVIEGSIGARRNRRLRENESYEELLLLGECDRAGRQVGVATTELEDALDYIREISDRYS